MGYPPGLIPGPVDLLDPADRLHPANSGLNAWWLALGGFAGGPTARDLVGTSTGTLSGGAGWGPTSRTGGEGELRFDGVAAQVSAPLPAAASGAYSAACWAYLSGTSL